MKRFGILAFTWLAASAMAAPQSDGIDPLALQELVRKLSPPEGKMTDDQLKLLQQYLKDPQKMQELQKMIRDNPELAQLAKIQKDKFDPKQWEDLQNIVRQQRNNPIPNDPRSKPATPNTPTTQNGEPPTIPNPMQPTPPNPMNPERPRLPQRDPRQPQETEDYRKAAKMWEQMVGPLNKTPAVRKVLQQIMLNMKDSNGKTPSWFKPGNSSGFSAKPSWLMRQMNKLGSSSTWDFSGGNTNINWGNNSSSNAIPEPGSMDGFSFDSPSSGLYVLGFLLVGLILFLILKRIIPALKTAKTEPQPVGGLGPWPIDPRTIANRADLVRAFEYLSVLLCGDGARVWNHVTIAEALRDQVPQSASIADPLARYYALARYSPMHDHFTSEMVAEARGYLCQLAGVSANPLLNPAITDS